MGSLTAADGQNRDVRFPPFELGHTAAARLMHTRKEPKSLHVCANLISFVIYDKTQNEFSTFNIESRNYVYPKKTHRQNDAGRKKCQLKKSLIDFDDFDTFSIKFPHFSSVQWHPMKYLARPKFW